jgi:phosphatidylserine decarboxylase
MLSKCVQCGFYVRQNDEFCPNCGYVNSFDNSPLWKKHKFTLLILIASTILLFVIISLISKNWQEEIIPVFFISFVISLFVAVMFEFNLESKKDFENSERFFRRSLKHKARTIDKRIEELINRKNKINSVLYQIGTEPSKNLQPVRGKLLSAQKILETQSARYRLKQEKIKLVRLQNKVLSYLLYLEKLDESITKEGIYNSDNTIREVSKIRESLRDNFPINVESERSDFLKNLDETSQSCEKLWEALLSKQALFALKDVQPTNEIGQILHAEELAHATETFNLQAKLTDFSESFDELEAEYKRLTADDEITQNFLTE